MLFSVYALAVLTILSFVVFVILLLNLRSTNTHERADQLQELNIQEVLRRTKELLDSLNKAKPVAIAALITILLLVAWLFVLSLYVSTHIPQ